MSRAQRVLHALPLVLGRTERLAIATRLMEPVTKEAMAVEDPNAKIEPLSVLAKG